MSRPVVGHLCEGFTELVSLEGGTVVIPPSTMRRPQCRKGMPCARGLVVRKRQGWPRSPGLPDLGLHLLPRHFVCSAVYHPTHPVKLQVALSHFTVEKTEARRGKVTCPMSHNMWICVYVPHF